MGFTLDKVVPWGRSYDETGAKKQRAAYRYVRDTSDVTC